jgi:hypothetical protein
MNFWLRRRCKQNPGKEGNSTGMSGREESSTQMSGKEGVPTWIPG